MNRTNNRMQEKEAYFKLKKTIINGNLYFKIFPDNKIYCSQSNSGSKENTLDIALTYLLLIINFAAYFKINKM